MKKLCLASLVFAAACTSQTAGDQTGHLQANADAQHTGIYSYAVDGDVVTLFDKDGIEAGRLAISAPTTDRRTFNAELADGTTDELEVYRPKADGTFFAPIAPQTTMTAAVADPALAPLFASHGVTFRVVAAPLLARMPGGVAADTLATTTVCSGGGTKPWNYTTPAGCVRSANSSECYSNDGQHTDLGPSTNGSCSAYTGGYTCTNPSQLPPTIFADTGADAALQDTIFSSLNNCTKNVDAWCTNVLGAGNYDFADCYYTDAPHGACYGRITISQWIASCPRQTPANGGCTTSGQFDAVPRQDFCYDPGSCTFQQGGTSCTAYH